MSIKPTKVVFLAFISDVISLPPNDQQYPAVFFIFAASLPFDVLLRQSRSFFMAPKSTVSSDRNGLGTMRSLPRADIKGPNVQMFRRFVASANKVSVQTDFLETVMLRRRNVWHCFFFVGTKRGKLFSELFFRSLYFNELVFFSLPRTLCPPHDPQNPRKRDGVLSIRFFVLFGSQPNNRYPITVANLSVGPTSITPRLGKDKTGLPPKRKFEIFLLGSDDCSCCGKAVGESVFFVDWMNN